MVKILNKIIFYISIVVTFSVTIQAQAQTDRVLVELADEMYEFGDYEDALGIYLQALEENPVNLRANFMAGRSYLRTTAEKPMSVRYFLKAYELDPDVHPDIFYLTAEGYRFGNRFDEAIQFYGKYIQDINTNRRKFANQDSEELKKKTNRKIEECKTAKEFIKNPVKVKIQSLGPIVNSHADDYAPTISKENDVLIFTSRRAGGMSVLKDVDNKFFEDIYVSEFENGDWGQPKNLGEPINSEQHDANINLNPNGTRLYLYKTENLGDIYFTEKTDGKWGKPEALKKPINSPSKETSVYETSDGMKMFFSSDREGGQGRLDLYVAYGNGKGKWSKVENLGAVVNTEYDEEGPFFDEANNVLYFSSKGHNGMGNYDLFKTIYDPEKNTWSKPENLGYPISSSDDDLYYVVASDGITAYYSSYKSDSEGGLDIYRISPADDEPEQKEEPIVAKDPDPVPEEPKDTTETVVQEDSIVNPNIEMNSLIEKKDPVTPVKEVVETPVKEVVKTPETVVMKSVKFDLSIYDMQTNTPVVAKISIIRVSDDKRISEGSAVNGDYSFVFKPDLAGEYMATVEATGYLFQTFKISVSPKPTETTITKKLAMRPPKENVINIFRNIYFDFDEFTLKNSSHNELDKLVDMMLNSPHMKVEIAGHTDFIGSADYNYQLSKKRAQSVFDFLVKKGVNPSNITIKGYGKTKPLASNDDEKEGRALNRRTEFIILQKK